jgi:outer membrane protein assembly factor BamB
VDDALRELERAARARPDDALAHFRLGAARLRLGREAEAATALVAALAIDPGHAEAARGLARLPGIARGPWPSEVGGADAARRSPFPGARRGVVLRESLVPAPPRGAPVVAASGDAFVATGDGAWRIARLGEVEPFGPREPQRGPPVLASGGALVLLQGEQGLGLADASGRVVWARDLGARAFDPLVAGDLLLVGVEHEGLLALDLASGRERWRVAIDAEGFSRPALSSRGVAWVAVRGDRPAVVRGYDEAWSWQLHGIDLAGRVVASTDARPERDAAPPDDPALSPAGDVVLARVGNDLLTFRASDASPLARLPATVFFAVQADGTARALGEGPLAIDGEGTTFVAEQERVTAIDRSGDLLWRCPVKRTTSRPVVGNGCVLVASYHEKTVTWIG